MKAIEELEVILARLERCPLNLVRVELDTFRHILEREPYVFSALKAIVSREDGNLGQKAPNIVDELQNSAWHSLEFANRSDMRAAVGYQVLIRLLEGYRDWGNCGKQVVQLGALYAGHLGDRTSHTWSGADFTNTFAQVFLIPIITYLKQGINLHDHLLWLLKRYKQRLEWFGDQSKIEAEVKKKGDLENRLRREMLQYLFDNGVDFSIESQEPSGGGRVDILPILGDRGQLPIEVKVFDGDRAYASRGLAQAAEYGRMFNQPNAYYFLYNVARDTIVRIPGTDIGNGVTSNKIGNIDVYSVVANVQNTLPASQAANLKQVEISVQAD